MPNMANTSYSDFADYIRAKMQERGLTQPTLAEAAGVSPNTINRMVNGKGPFGADTINKVATALKENADYLKHLAGLVAQRTTSIEDPEVVELALQIENLTPARRQQVLQIVRATLGLAQYPDDQSLQNTQHNNYDRSTTLEPADSRSALETAVRVAEVRAEMEKLPTVKEQMAFLYGVAMGDREVFNTLDELIRGIQRSGDAKARGDVGREAG